VAMAHHSPGIVDEHIDRPRPPCSERISSRKEYRMLLGFVQRLLPSRIMSRLSGADSGIRRRHPKERMTLTNGTRKRLTVAIVGAGGVCGNSCRSAQKHAAGAADGDLRLRSGEGRGIQQKFGLVGSYASLRTMLADSQARRGTHRDTALRPCRQRGWSV